MCGPSSTADRLLLIHGARVVAERVLNDGLRIPVSKALRLDTPRGFDRAVALLAAKMRRAAGGSDADAVRAAVGALNIDWSRSTPEIRRRAIDGALARARRVTSEIPARIEVPLGHAAQEVVAAARSEVRGKQGLAIGARFNAVDRRLVDHIAHSQTHFVRDEYGRRIDAFGAQARQIVADGVKEGLGQKQIAADLERAARDALVRRAPFYWEVIAASFVGRGRSWAQMSAYAEAGIRRYQIEAVLDEVTTPICRFLHHKTFSVGAALDRFARVETLEDPEEVKLELPWARERRNGEDASTIYVNGRGGRTEIAEVVRSGVGTRDDVGSFRALASDARIADVGLGFPPYHGQCRTTTLAIV